MYFNTHFTKKIYKTKTSDIYTPVSGCYANGTCFTCYELLRILYMPNIYSIALLKHEFEDDHGVFQLKKYKKEHDALIHNIGDNV